MIGYALGMGVRTQELLSSTYLSSRCASTFQGSPDVMRVGPLHIWPGKATSRHLSP